MGRTHCSSGPECGWFTAEPGTSLFLPFLLLLLQVLKDCELVSSDGVGTVSTHCLLLSLHSPLLASLLGLHRGMQALSLPLPLPAIRGLVSLLQGQGAGKGVTEHDVKDAAELLGIPWQGLQEGFRAARGEDQELFDSLKTNIVDSNLTYTEHPLNMKNKRNFGKYNRVNDPDSNLTKDEEVSVLGFPTVKSEKRGSNAEPCKIHGNVGKQIHNSERKTSEQKKKDFSCSACRMHFYSKRFLKRHQLKKHDIAINCEKCSEVFTEYKRFKEHLNEVHPSYVCQVCQNESRDQTSLDIHVESKHQENIPCPKCGQMYASKQSLNGHNARVHSDKEPKKCTNCDYKTHFASELKVHFKRTHTEDTKKTCQYCGDIFKDLKSHLHRTGCGGQIIERKKVPCDRCSKEFNTKINADKHKKDIHGGVKDKKCRQCSYATYNSFNLKLHISKMHLGSGLGKEVCLYCDKTTTNLKYHKKMYHPLAPSS